MKRKSKIMLFAGGCIVVFMLGVMLNPLSIQFDPWDIEPIYHIDPFEPAPFEPLEPIYIDDPIDPIIDDPIRLVGLLIPPAPIVNKIYPNPDTDGTITVSWTMDYDDMTAGYDVFRSVNGGLFTLLTQTVQKRLIDINLGDGTYSYKVKAYNAAGYSKDSNVVSVTIKIPSLPTAPVLYNPPTPNTDGIIALSWSDPGNTKGFEVFRSVNGSVFTLLTQTWLPFYTDSNLDDGVYYYEIRAYDDDGRSDYSNVVSVSVIIPIDTIPIEPPVPIVYVPPPDPPAPIETTVFEISPWYYLLLIGGLGIVLFLVYKRMRKKS